METGEKEQPEILLSFFLLFAPHLLEAASFNIHISWEEKGEAGPQDKEIHRCGVTRNLGVNESHLLEGSQNQEQGPHLFSLHAEG